MREDTERLPAHELELLVRAAIAASDRPTLYLYHRYLGQKNDPAQAEIRHELAALFDAPDVHQKCRALAEKLRAAKSLPVAVSAARRAVDGRHERMLAGMRAQYAI